MTINSSFGTPRRLSRARRRGAMVVVIVFMLVVFFVTLAFSIDVAYMQLTRTELRTATDAAARAGAEALSRQLSQADALQAAKDAAARNNVAGDALVLDDADIVFGTSALQTDGSWSFSAGGNPVNAVHILGRRTNDAPSGAVTLFFGGMVGRPTFEPIQEAIASQLDRDICIVMDRSGSMAWDLSGTDDSYPPGGSQCTPPHATLSRWGAADAAVDAFLAEIAITPQDEQIALVTYASAGEWCDTTYNAADIELELTTNHAAVTTAVDNRGSQPIPGRTSISAGIDQGILTLTNPATTRPHAVKTMIVLTDGIHNEGTDPVVSATSADAANITVHTITFSSGADQQKMIDVANEADGNHYHAPDAQALQDIFREIAATLPVVLTE